MSEKLTLYDFLRELETSESENIKTFRSLYLSSSLEDMQKIVQKLRELDLTDEQINNLLTIDCQKKEDVVTALYKSTASDEKQEQILKIFQDSRSTK